MSASDDNIDIRIDIVDKFYDGLDKLIDKIYKEDNISYGEIEMGFLKMDEKILQQKISLMHQYLHSDEQKTQEAPHVEKEDPDMYG